MCMKYVEQMYKLRLIKSTKNLELKKLEISKRRVKKCITQQEIWDWRRNKEKEEKKF